MARPGARGGLSVNGRRSNGCQLVGALARRIGERRSHLQRLTGRRLLAACVLLPLITLGTFALAAASPRDPLVSYLGDAYERVSAQDRAATRSALGLDRGWMNTWWYWVQHAAHGDFGNSHSLKQPVTQVIAERLPWTLGLTVTSAVLATILALLTSWVVARRPGGFADRTLARAALVLSAVPPFVVCLVLVTVFAVTLRLLPVSGAYDPGQAPSVGALLEHLALPTVALALGLLPWMMLTMREAVWAAWGSEPVRVARTRGLPASVIERRHILPVSLQAIIALLGSRAGELVAGALVVEEIFSWPGLAGAGVDAALTSDFALLAAITVLTSVVMLVGTWLADCALLIVDPRVEVE